VTDARSFDFSAAEIAAISQALEAKGVYLRCSRCADGAMTLCNGYFALPMSWGLADAGRVFGARSVYPALGLACANCGHMEFHGLAQLGLLDLYKQGGPR
jgi:hypothetical protein